MARPLDPRPQAPASFRPPLAIAALWAPLQWASLLWAPLLGGLALRLIGQALWPWQDVDHASYLELAGDLAAGRGLDSRGLRYWPPLFPVLVALGQVLGLSGRAAAGLVTAGTGALLAWPAAVLARRWGGERAAGVAAWGAALLPPLVLAGHRGLAEAPVMLLVLGAAAVVVGPGRPVGRGLAAGALLALAWMTRFEWILCAAGVGLLLAARADRARALAGLALGLGLAMAPYQALLLHLGEGWLVPATRLASNLAETASAGAVGFGFEAAGALPEAPTLPSSRGEVLQDRLAQVGLSLAQLPRAVPLSLALLAAAGARRVPRGELAAMLLLAMPALASFLAVDHESRYWLSLSVGLLPLAAVGLARLPSRAWPAVALGLLWWPRARFPDAPLSVLGPGEDLVGSLVTPEISLAAAEGLAVLLLRPGLLLLGLASLALLVGRRRLGRALGRLGLSAPEGLARALVPLACLAALAVGHLEHARASLPARPLAANLDLVHRVPAGARVLCARSLDAHVLGGVFVPPPRLDLSPEEVQAYAQARGVHYVLLDPADPRGGAMQAWAAREQDRGGLVLARQAGPLSLWQLR